MARFLKNHGITNAIEDLIRNASRRLVLISPYLQLSDAIKRTLEVKVRDGLPYVPTRSAAIRHYRIFARSRFLSNT
ncbi:MAG: hypothetical protein CTY19_07525 [Methylomonas sp.]|nr:MAG: hypothetical protein CTY19_07525 [Methylomonas sp.]